ncbi:MAG: hypothetical protein JRN39_06580 [Nitrososphaerota archaeon]|nr:hypothetical protein [Nitrososphaerota archaeon]
MELTWKYSASHSPPAPVMQLKLGGSSVDLALDTGFAGGILLPLPLFESFGLLSSLSPDEYHLVLPDSRRLPLYTSKENVKVGEVAFRAEVHSSPLVNRRVAGRSFLGRFVASLDGPEEQLRIRFP